MTMGRCPSNRRLTIRASAALTIRSRNRSPAFRDPWSGTRPLIVTVWPTARHARFHPVAEAGCNPSIVVEPPVLDHPQQVAIDPERLAFLDNQCTGKPTSKLLQRVGVWVIPEGASIGRRELVVKALAGADGWLGDPWHAVHRVRQADAVPVDGRSLVEIVVDHHPDPI